VRAHALTDLLADGHHRIQAAQRVLKDEPDEPTSKSSHFVL
jgi:uncharacterized protein (DUF1015 family)